MQKRSFIFGLAATLLSIGAVFAAPIGPVDVGDVISGVEAGGGPDLAGAIRDGKPEMDDDEIVGRRWLANIDANGNPTSRAGGKYLAKIRVGNSVTERGVSYNCYIELVDFRTGEILRIADGGIDTTAGSVEEAVSQAMQDFNTGADLDAFDTPPY